MDILDVKEKKKCEIHNKEIQCLYLDPNENIKPLLCLNCLLQKDIDHSNCIDIKDILAYNKDDIWNTIPLLESKYLLSQLVEAKRIDEKKPHHAIEHFFSQLKEGFNSKCTQIQKWIYSNISEKHISLEDLLEFYDRISQREQLKHILENMQKPLSPNQEEEYNQQLISLINNMKHERVKNSNELQEMIQGFFNVQSFLQFEISGQINSEILNTLNRVEQHFKRAILSQQSVDDYMNKIAQKHKSDEQIDPKSLLISLIRNRSNNCNPNLLKLLTDEINQQTFHNEYYKSMGICNNGKDKPEQVPFDELTNKQYQLIEEITHILVETNRLKDKLNQLNNDEAPNMIERIATLSKQLEKDTQQLKLQQKQCLIEVRKKQNSTLVQIKDIIFNPQLDQQQLHFVKVYQDNDRILQLICWQRNQFILGQIEEELSFRQTYYLNIDCTPYSWQNKPYIQISLVPTDNNDSCNVCESQIKSCSLKIQTSDIIVNNITKQNHYSYNYLNGLQLEFNLEKKVFQVQNEYINKRVDLSKLQHCFSKEAKFKIQVELYNIKNMVISQFTQGTRRIAKNSIFTPKVIEGTALLLGSTAAVGLLFKFAGFKN